MSGGTIVFKLPLVPAKLLGVHRGRWSLSCVVVTHHAAAIQVRLGQSVIQGTARLT